LVCLVVVLALVAVPLLWKRSQDLTFLDNRVASTAQRCVAGDAPMVVSLSRYQVTCTVFTGTSIEIRQSRDGKTIRAAAESKAQDVFDTDAVAWVKGADLLKRDGTITQLRVVATSDPMAPQVIATLKGGGSRALKPDFTAA